MAITKKKVAITPPNFQVARFRIQGTAPLVGNKFPSRIIDEMAEKQAAGSVGRKGSKREPKDFEALWKEAMHVSDEGWPGIPANAFRAALVSACRLCGFKMTFAKLSIFVVEDGYEHKQPLIKITKGNPERFDSAVRNRSGVADIRARPSWREGWEAIVTLRFDADQFTLEDVTNLLARVGAQVGIGAGRHDSKESCGMGWGSFRIAESVK